MARIFLVSLETGSMRALTGQKEARNSSQIYIRKVSWAGSSLLPGMKSQQPTFRVHPRSIFIDLTACDQRHPTLVPRCTLSRGSFCILAMVISRSLDDLVGTVYLFDQDEECERVRYDKISELHEPWFHLLHEFQIDTIAPTDDEYEIFRSISSMFDQFDEFPGIQSLSTLITEDDRS